MESTIRELITVALKELFDMKDVAFAVERPKELSHGDYATNIALVLAKQLETRPQDIAEQIVAYIKKNQPAKIAEVTIAGAGFINFSLSKEFFNEQIKNILEKKTDWGKNNLYKDKTILVEHSSPNLFKAFHIGHVMNNAIGESIKRLATFSGAEVIAISYPSDISLGIAKAVYILMKDGGLEKLNTFNIPSEEIAYLGDCYVRGTALYEDDLSVQSEIRMIADSLYKGDKNTPAYKIYEEGKNRNITYFKAVTSALGSHFDGFIYESEAGKEGKKIVEENIGKVFTESDGVVIYEGEKDGLHTRVFINKEGNPTYEAKDTGLIDLKFKKYNPDLSLFVTDHQQTEYFKVVLAAVRRINDTWIDRANKTIHRTHGRMTFKGQKMSSRLGGVPSAQELLTVLYEELNERVPGLSKETDGEANQSIAVAALKFVILRAMAGKDINFDPDTSLSFEGDSGPYLQYSTVRANSILIKASGLDAKLLSEWQTVDLEKILIHFPEVVKHSIQEWSPHFIVTYLLELAQAFNSWYGNTKIIDDMDATSPYKLALTAAFAQTMTNGLYLLGINVPEKM